MQFNKKRLAAATATAAAAALAFGAPLATAGGDTGGKHHSHHHNSITAPVKVTILDTDVTGTDEPTVVLRSPFRLLHERGSDQVVNDNKDVLQFANGNLAIDHKASWQRNRQDPVTGLFTHVERGSWWVDRHGDTGVYRHGSGGGHYFVKVVGVGDPDTKPVVIETDIEAKGKITLRLPRHHHDS